MFDFFKKKPAQATISLYDLLFADIPWERWPADDSQVALACARIKEGKRDEAVEILRRITIEPSAASRDYIQAWHFLRELGQTPPQSLAKHVYGVVLEVPVSGGRDTLAVYADHQARYLNYSGKLLVWE